MAGKIRNGHCDTVVVSRFCSLPTADPALFAFFPLRYILLIAVGSLLTAFCSKAATYYWDANGSTSGFGVAGGTWTIPTNSLWTTKSDGTAIPLFNLTTSISDDIYFGGDNTVSYLQSGTVNISGTVNARNINFGAYSEAIHLAGGTINLGATSTISCKSLHTKTISAGLSGAATSLTLTGGTLVLSGNNSYAGQTILSSGTLAITGSLSGAGAINLNGGVFNLGNSTSGGTLAATVLNMNGGEFRYSRTDSATQSFATTQLTSTQATFVIDTGNTLNLGTVSRTVGTTPSLSYTGLGTLAANADSNVGGIIPGLHFGNHWAVANGAGSKITALTSYTQTSVAGTAALNHNGGNIDVNNSAGTLSAGINANSIRFGTAAANILTLTGLNTLASGGILISSTVGNNLSTITGGSLAGAVGKDLHIIQSNASNGLTIASSIANNESPTALTKSGTGLLTLSGNNTFTGGLIINDGEVALANPGALNSTAGSENPVNFTKRDGGTLSLKGNSITLGSLNGVFIDALSSTHTVQNVSASNVTLTIGNSLGLNSTFDGPIQNGTGTGTLALVKRGSGTLTLTNPNNNYSGGTTIHEGTLMASRSGALGASTSTISFAGNSTFRPVYNSNPTIAQAIWINSGVTAKFDSSNQFYKMRIDGQINGSGTLWIASSDYSSGDGEVTLYNANNTHSGPIRIGDASKNGNLIVLSLADANNPIEFGGTTGSGYLNIYGTSARDFSQRTFTLSGTTGGASISNWMVSTSRVVTIAKNLAITGVGNKTLTLGGTNLGLNAFNGFIPDGTGSIISFTKEGYGKWVLSKTANTYSGPTRIMDGTLEIKKISDGGAASSIGQSGSGPKNLIFGPADSTLRYTGTGDSTDRNFIMLGNVTLESSGSGAIVFDQNAIISPDVTGLIGTFYLGNPTVYGLASTADLMVGMAVTSDAFNGTKIITAINSNSSITLDTGTGIQFGTFGLTVGYVTNRTLRLAGTQTAANTISGVLQDSSNHSSPAAPGFLKIVKQDAGTWRLDGLNTYTGGTIVRSGTLEVNSLADGGQPSSIGAATSDAGKVVLANGTTLRYTGDGHRTNRYFTMVGSATIDASGSGALVFEQTGAMSPDITWLTGTFTSNNATVNGLASTESLVVGMTVTSAAFIGTKTISAINSSSSITLNSGTGISAGYFGISAAMAGPRTLTLCGNNAAANTITGIRQDSSVVGSVLSLVKNDSGTWILAGNNTYTGTTTINGGTLLVSGSLSANSGVIINGAATLGGNGTYAGSLTLTADTNLAPGTPASIAPVGNMMAADGIQYAAGASIGTLSIGGNLNISAMAAGNGKLQFELGALDASDRIAVGGTLSIGAAALGFKDFTFTRLQGLQNGTYTLVSSSAPVSGTLDPNDLSGRIGNGGTGTLQISPSGTSIELVITVPAFYLWSDDALFGSDNNGDGMSNGLAFLLGAANPREDARGLHPAVKAEAGGLVLSFKMRKAEKRGNAAILLQHSGALGLPDTWTEVAVPEVSGGGAQGVTFNVSQNQSNADLHDVTATISSSEEVDGKLFGRLKATE